MVGTCSIALFSEHCDIGELLYERFGIKLLYIRSTIVVYLLSVGPGGGGGWEEHHLSVFTGVYRKSALMHQRYMFSGLEVGSHTHHSLTHCLKKFICIVLHYNDGPL